MRIAWISLALVVLAICASCDGGGGFVPTPGVFSGEFLVAGEPIGSFTVHVNGNSFGGGGTLVHNTYNVNVAVSSLISGATITGRVENASLGHGSFIGRFNGDNLATGDFTYTDEGGISTTTGTWVAERN